MDPKLARGHVRQEMRAIGKNVETLQRTGDLAREGAAAPIYQGRYPSPEQLTALAGRIATIFADNPNTLVVERQGSGKTLSRRKFFEDVRAVALAPNALTGEAAIEVVAHHFKVDSYTSAHGSPPVQIYRHACERLLERKGAADEPTWTLSNDIVGTLGLLALMARPLWGFPQRGIALPTRHGLLLGTVEDTFFGKPTREIGLNGGSRVTKGHVEEAGQGCFGLLVDPATQPPLVMHAKTYVGPQDLFDDQREFIARINAVLGRHEDLVHLMGVGVAFPYATEVNSALKVGTPLGDELDAACEEVIDILVDPRMARAVGNTALPQARPESPTRFFHRKAQERKEREARIESQVDGLIAEAIRGSLPGMR